MDETIKYISRKLNIAPFELKKMIHQILDKETYQEELLELLGYDNIEYISTICENKDYFQEKEEDIETKKYYIEFCLPEFKTLEIDENSLLSTDFTGTDSQYFEYTKFNAVQSAVFKCAYKTDSNFLVCAPTGSGKTDVALLAILRALKKVKSKIVYIVPMKALACEITYKYRSKLTGYSVVEFTGDTEVNNSELLKSNLIICTPEKFDAYTRKSSNIFQDFVSLVIIDEIHILQDDRGSVLEAIVSRLFRYTEIKQKHIRVVGLSATLPNFKDVGDFLKTKNVFNFDQSYRPVPLKTSILGIYQNTTRKQFDNLFVERVDNLRRNNKQVLVFVTSRHETILTGKLLINPDYTCEIDRKIKLNDTLEHILGHKIGIHHAGLPRNIRLYMENKFKKGDIDILVCTSTLAWGVNLPAHGVVIKGTTFYDSNLGKFRDLGILDIYQIFGRAGRPQYKITGEAILITEYKKVGDYMRMIKNNMEVESKLLRHVANLLNSEIYLNNINNISDGLNWFRNTFMYIRLLKNPNLYGLSNKDIDNEDTVLSEYIYLTVKRLEEYKLISIHRDDTDNYTRWKFSSTEFGRISSFYYLDHETVLNWLKNIDFISSQEDILKLILENKDFSNIQIRKDEEYNLQEIASNMDLYVEKVEDSKLYILIMCTMRNYSVPQFSLKCDQGYISKNVERIMNAFIEVLEYLNRYNLLLISLEILSRLFPRSNRVQVISKFTLNIFDCGSFLKIHISSEELQKFYLIVYFEDFPLYISHGYKSLSTFIRRDNNIKDRLKISIYDVSRNLFKEDEYRIKKSNSIDSLLINGYHSCSNGISLLDTKKECDHVRMVDEDIIRDIKALDECINSRKFIDESGKILISGKYSIDVNFFISYISVYQEFLRQFVTASLNYLKSDEPVMIICRSKCDYKLLNQEIYTRLALNNFESGKNTFKKITHSINNISNNNICIITLEEALLCDKNIFTIFLTCQDNSNVFYSFYDILQVCHNKKVLIYEREEFIEYFKNSILN
jgi:replicative superfamily II helicase